MDASARSSESLDSSSEVIVRLIERIVNEQWPTGFQSLNDYFARLRCVPGAATEREDGTPTGVTRGAFALPGTSVKDASWTALEDDLFALNFFAYEGTALSSATDVDAGYDAVREGVSDLFGPSLDERTDQRGNRSAVWQAQESVIELYAHVNEGPVLQVGVAHEGRTATHQHLIAQASEHPKH